MAFFLILSVGFLSYSFAKSKIVDSYQKEEKLNSGYPLFLDLVHATSGACSSHEGVVCSLGPDWDQSVICEDGWRDSIVNYWDVEECNDYWCTGQKVLYDALYAKSDWSTGTSQLDEEFGITPTTPDQLIESMEQRNQELAQQYQYLIDTVNSVRSSCDSECSDIPNSYRGNDKICYCNDGYEWSDVDSACISTAKDPIVANIFCEVSYGEYAYYDSEADDCFCEAGYTLGDNGQCVVVQNEESNLFNDVSSGDEYFDAIFFVKSQGIVEGYSDGTYKPESNINRAEFTKILIGSAFPDEVDYSGDYSFSDVSSTAWYAKYIFLAKREGIITGYPDGTFKPDQTVNVAEALKITLETYFDDIPDVDGAWYQKYWDFASTHNYLVPEWYSIENQLTRGQMAELIYKIKNN